MIWGIGGGVATAAFEICRAFGVNTIVTSGSAEKLAKAREWGADVVLDHNNDDVVAAVKDATGAGVDVVVETVGEATWARSLAAVGRSAASSCAAPRPGRTPRRSSTGCGGSS